ncbi:metallophosphoesterase [Tropicibacter sp. R16_0]|uniref:metallophosphoesterase n=1 Tax=Tropicibacter sp. R16_0 TaxID=2821102 RepID=UPI001ADA6530|nr:metallophosphoesterase [Tropicibacter sp. R16_0]MBO9452019.1 metallophosphoesterase [Tropicibacter sp. R16_0]
MTRRGFLRGLLAVTLAGLFAAFYGFFIEPALRLRVRRWRIRRAGWTAPPLKIVVLSDLHVGEPFVGLKRIRQIVKRVNALDADLVLLLGDYAAGHKFVTEPVNIADLAPILAECRARHGVYAVLGNHDWWDDLGAQRRGGGPNLYAQALSAQGIHVLSNQAIRLEGPDIWLAGLEDQLAIRRNGRWAGLDDLPGTLAQITDEAPVVLMAHEPDIFTRVPDRVALTLSGHTHGGQVRLLGWSPVVPSRFGNRYAYGHVRETGRDLVVSGGIGCSIMPVRFGVVPEITVIEVTSDQSAGA